jgi:hypothetical protein
MIFDDHEIINDWNIVPRWRARAIEHGMERLLVDGLVAYWIYQGWGNLCERRESHPLTSIMQQAEQSGEDALEALRACVKQEVYGIAPLQWHYKIPTTPPIFVLNARAERTAVFTNDPQEIYAPGRIMSRSQIMELEEWMQKQATSLSILVSSVPVLLPPLIGLAEYIMGMRLWQGTLLRKLGLQLARLQEQLALKTSFDHWPAFGATWQELVQLLREHKWNVLFLSGDVHFSYAVEADLSSSPSHMYQFVSTPLQNKLSSRDRRLIEMQASITRTTYGSLHMRMLPLIKADGKGRIERDLLFQNTVAIVRVQPEEENRYHVQQEYLGIVDGQMEVIARTILPQRV